MPAKKEKMKNWMSTSFCHSEITVTLIEDILLQSIFEFHEQGMTVSILMVIIWTAQ